MAEGFDLAVESEELNDLIDKMSKTGQTRSLMKQVGNLAVNDARLNFRNQSSPQGIPWKRTHRGGSILRDTSRLRNSITSKLKSDDEVEIGTNVIYGPIHQYGGIIKAKNAPYLKFMIGGRFVQVKKVTIPARPFLGIGPRLLKKIDKALLNWSEDYASPD